MMILLDTELKSQAFIMLNCHETYKLHSRHTSNITGTLVGNKTVDHSDVVGAPPVGAAPTTSSFLT